MSELKATDKEEFENCKEDMKKLAQLDEESAKIVTSAIRAKNIPLMAKTAGLDLEDEKVRNVITTPIDDQIPNEKSLTNDLSNDVEKDSSMVDGEDLEESPAEGVEELKQDIGEAEDSGEEELEAEEGGKSQIYIELPSEMVPEIKKALESVIGQSLDEQFGGETTEEFSKEEPEFEK